MLRSIDRFPEAGVHDGDDGQRLEADFIKQEKLKLAILGLLQLHRQLDSECQQLLEVIQINLKSFALRCKRRSTVRDEL